MASGHPDLTPRPTLQWLRSLANDTAGAALVEITMFMPILVADGGRRHEFRTLLLVLDLGGERGAGGGAMGHQ